ncbi:GNAT family N-acetyltransferase [Desulfosarcina sp. OttesenSCG-928-A07]|nr:GNAT family N-acetyltransferase [Desulfosarcina sp. OttesenSCG-928-G17]MDL2329843.1 GNAT family N-acetyltransferase [Desulfosarcina sp. OttesenSCG-928-A07]
MTTPDFKFSPPHPAPLPPTGGEGEYGVDPVPQEGGEGEHGINSVLPEGGAGEVYQFVPALPSNAPNASFTSFRDRLVPEDVDRVRELVERTGFFYPAEVEVAAELVSAHLQHGDASGYFFIMADGGDGKLAGYACFGPVPCTVSSYDLYWIAVLPEAQGSGLGRRLLVEAERRIRIQGGTRVYVETSMRPQYDGTRAFYERCGYGLEAILADFYAPGDGKGIYCKPLTPPDR